VKLFHYLESDNYMGHRLRLEPKCSICLLNRLFRSVGGRTKSRCGEETKQSLLRAMKINKPRPTQDPILKGVRPSLARICWGVVGGVAFLATLAVIASALEPVILGKRGLDETPLAVSIVAFVIVATCCIVCVFSVGQGLFDEWKAWRTRRESKRRRDQ
jgi:hypothetical protein